MVRQWILDKKPIRPVVSYGAGKRTTYVDHSGTIYAILEKIGAAPVTEGNDAPRGGAMGKWIKPSQWAKFKPMRDAAIHEHEHEQEHAKEQADAQKRAKQQMERETYEHVQGDDRAVLMQWWNSKAFHPAPEPVLKAKESIGWTWKQVRTYCKSQHA